MGDDDIMKKVYLDNAATTFPKPKCVIDAMVDFMTNIGCNPGRGGYEQSLESARLVFQTRNALNNFFNGPGVDNVIFTPNITTSLNIALKGMLKKDSHVITTSLEHNSVMRPLRSLENERGISCTVIKCSNNGTLNLEDIKKSIAQNTKAIVMTHASNLIGTILPIEDVGNLCRDYGLYFIVDTAQTAGTLNIDFKKSNMDVLTFTGHKGLLGPQGIGGFLISDRADKVTSSFIEGGTGSKSHLEIQPDFLPDKFESGTLNTVGIAGLKAGIEFINYEGVDNIRLHESSLTGIFMDGLMSIKGIDIYGTRDINRQTSTIAINIKDMDPSEAAYILDSQYGIMIRSGMHCTPLAHKTIGTFPRGALRFSIGYFNTEEEICYTLEALKKISNEY